MPAPDNLLALMRRFAARLAEAGLEEPAKEAEALMTSVLGITTASLYTSDMLPEAAQVDILLDALKRRARREPLHYITGRVEFMGLDLRITPDVLIPRPETELLVRECLNRSATMGGAPRVADICTGSGAIALAVASLMPGARVTGTDISERAVALAAENAARNGIANAGFMAGDLLAPVAGMRFGAILANPPYIISSEIDSLAPEISAYEPRGALDGGPDGLDFYRRLVPGARELLVPGGFMLLEIGHGQGRDVADLARNAGYDRADVIHDIGGLERIVALG